MPPMIQLPTKRPIAQNSVRRNFDPAYEVASMAQRLHAAAAGEEKAHQGLNTAAYHGAQLAALEASALANDAELWAEFIALEFWAGIEKARPKRESQRNALRYTMRMACGGDSKKASDRFRAVTQLLSEGIRIDDLAVELKKRGGFRGVNSQAEPKTNSAPKPAASRPSSTQASRSPQRKTSSLKAPKTIAAPPRSQVHRNSKDGPFALHFPEMPSCFSSAQEGAIFMMGVEFRGLEFHVFYSDEIS